MFEILVVISKMFVKVFVKLVKELNIVIMFGYDIVLFYFYVGGFLLIFLGIMVNFMFIVFKIV